MKILNKELFLAIFIINCSPTLEPTRLDAIPADAIWYGGSDGGCWITVGNAKLMNQYKITVYDENSGEIWEKGVFKFNRKCSMSKMNKVDILSLISGFDGHRILLKHKREKDCYLEKYTQ
ncbi:hypothetical protein [Leptospira wolffii]|nr:hypothetical protein [Leptospira wolffii]